MSTKDSESFSQNYKELNKLVKLIEGLEDENIDQINDYVSQALLLAEKCEDRVSLIKKSLEEKFKSQE